jgi:hypothetical protein
MSKAMPEKKKWSKRRPGRPVATGGQGLGCAAAVAITPPNGLNLRGKFLKCFKTGVFYYTSAHFAAENKAATMLPSPTSGRRQT